MSFFTEAEIREHAFAAVLDEGRRLNDLNQVTGLNFIGDDIIATVNDGSLFRVAISRIGKRLTFSCNCSYTHAGACAHVVAVMFAANGYAAIQVGINWDDLSPCADAADDGIPEAAPLSGQPYRKPPILHEPAEEGNADAQMSDLPVEKPAMRLYLTEREGMLFVEIRFAYYRGLVEFTRSDTSQSRLVAAEDGRVYRINRSRARETVGASQLLNFDLLHYQTGTYTPSTDPRDWTLQQLPLLAAEGFQIYGQERLQSTQARKSRPILNVSVSSQGDSLTCTVRISIDGVPATLAALIMAIRQKSRFILLSDGSSGMMPQEWLETFAALFAALEEQPVDNGIILKTTHIGLAEALCDMADTSSGDEAFREKQELLHTFKGVVPQSLPDGFSAILREYQHAGFEWFYFLKQFRFGGCLADDMGLGKTIQTLALLLKEKQLGEGQPSLVVVPNSLLFNWQRESKKFAQSINMLIYHGTNRHTYTNILSMADVILTTYGTILRDSDLLRTTMFHYVILDEAQAIKNPASRISKAVRSLNCRYRLALSGTPVENNLSELWALFAFINPGMMGTYSVFMQEYIKPIERELNESRLEVLKKMVYPFILRRTKVQVAKDLPPKSEIVLYSEMVPRQKTIYDITRELYYGRIRDSLEATGIQGSQIQLLEGLLRLRQICCHPLLYETAYNDDSGKFQLIEELLHDAVSEGHRVLVFSQFVSALELLRERLGCSGLSSELLTGQTRDRQKVVDRFQSGEGAPVFLISLKAGGTGLNLTAADYVFHLDPWWNPSVENQASDRAYRIGQTKPVFVYKMITPDSIEERVLELQEKKRFLTGNIIQTENAFFKHLSKSDILHLFE